MTRSVLDELRPRALALAAEDRAELAHELLVSLDGPPEHGVAAAWDVELRRRLDEVESGSVTLIEADEVMRKVRALSPAP